MLWKGPLKPEQTAHPVVWHGTLDALGYGDLITMPELTQEWFNALWGDDKPKRRLTTWGHKDKADKTSPHFLASRGGTRWHTDPAYVRYCLQLQLVNHGGYVVHGLEDDLAEMPLFTPGLVILLDAHSPHTVSRDLRLPAIGNNKLLAGRDFATRPSLDQIHDTLPKLLEHVPLLQLPA